MDKWVPLRQDFVRLDIEHHQPAIFFVHVWEICLAVVVNTEVIQLGFFPIVTAAIRKADLLETYS